jgi:putative addiction module component (TIGR02574 family)
MNGAPMNKVLLAELMQLSPAERVEIAQELWDSVGETELPPLTPAQMEELDRRVAEHERDPSTAITLEKFKEMMQARFK